MDRHSHCNYQRASLHSGVDQGTLPILQHSHRFLSIKQIARGLHIEISGSTCVAWSTMSQSAMGWLHSSSIPFIIWACMMRDIQPNVILHECVPKFDWQVQKHLFGITFECRSLVFGLDEVGFPSSRRRRYTPCTRHAPSPFPGAPRFQMGKAFDMDLKILAFRTLSTDGRVYLRGDKSMQFAQLVDMAARWHMPAGWASARRPLWSSLLARGSCKRLVKRARTIQANPGLETFFINIPQNPGYGASLTKDPPVLLRGNEMWAGGDFGWRPVLLQQLLAIQGFPVFTDDLRTPITTTMLAKMDSDKFKAPAKNMIGNCMHHGCVGSCLLFALLSLQRTG